MTPNCTLCVSPRPLHRHHLTGRLEPGGPYFDPGLTIPLCRPCHSAAGGVHPLLRSLGLDLPAPGASPLAYRLRRTGIHTVVVGTSGRPFVLDPTAAMALGRLLDDGAIALDLGRLETAS